ncbi:hypothetical protein BKA81DRAFT_378218 [Phyllosticta paracitricarpa]
MPPPPPPPPPQNHKTTNTQKTKPNQTKPNARTLNAPPSSQTGPKAPKRPNVPRERAAKPETERTLPHSWAIVPPKTKNRPIPFDPLYRRRKKEETPKNKTY